MSDLVEVRFTKHASKYNAGEAAEFRPEQAAMYVRAGVAAYEDPNMVLPEIVNDDLVAPRAQKDAQHRINRIALHCETLDEYIPQAWEQKTGKPDVKYLSQLFGQLITPAERDAAFELCQNKRRALGMDAFAPKVAPAEKTEKIAAKR